MIKISLIFIKALSAVFLSINALVVIIMVFCFYSDRDALSIKRVIKYNMETSDSLSLKGVGNAD
jgi:hypothetical protein